MTKAPHDQDAVRWAVESGNCGNCFGWGRTPARGLQPSRRVIVSHVLGVTPTEPDNAIAVDGVDAF